MGILRQCYDVCRHKNVAVWQEMAVGAGLPAVNSRFIQRREAQELRAAGPPMAAAPACSLGTPIILGTMRTFS